MVVVPHGYVVSYLYGRFSVQGVQHASILDVYPFPMRIEFTSPCNGAEPDAAIPSHLDVANDNRIVRQNNSPRFRVNPLTDFINAIF